MKTLDVGVAIKIGDGAWLLVREWHQPRDTVDTGTYELGTLPGPWGPATAVVTLTELDRIENVLEQIEKLPSTRLERVPLRVRTSTGEEYDASGLITHLDTSGRIEISDIKGVS